MSGMANSTPDDRATQVAAEIPLDEVLRDVGFQITDEGRAHWRRRMATPISAEALADGQRMLDRADGHAA
jgi:hypothetical protein